MNHNDAASHDVLEHDDPKEEDPKPGSRNLLYGQLYRTTNDHISYYPYPYQYGLQPSQPPPQPDRSLQHQPVPEQYGYFLNQQPSADYLDTSITTSSSETIDSDSSRLVKLALRKRGNSKKPRREKSDSQRRIGRPLNPKTRIRLTLVPDLMSLHSMLVPTHSRESFRVLQQGELPQKDVQAELTVDPSVEWKFRPHPQGEMFPGKSKTVVLVEENYLVDPEEQLTDPHYPSAIGIDGKHESNSSPVPIYDNLAAAVQDVFNVDSFSLVRVTRAAAFERTGPIVLKLETAHPGDIQLGDEDDPVADDPALGRHGDPVTSIFIKKKIARPRYKANMRIYLIPRDTNVILYSQQSMLKRDLLKNVLKLGSDPRMVLCAFDCDDILANGIL